MALTDNKIASGHNNTAGLTLIEELTDSDGVLFYPVNDRYQYQPGEFITRGDGIVIPIGLPTLQWQSHLTLAQWDYIYTSLLGNTYSGTVTIRTRTTTDTYANYNAILSITPPTDYDVLNGWINNFIWQFTHLEAI
ncbi:MAG: hypothetical protein D6712_15230 [Chloroflexi bacterium]|nr:MAG: hypothetical protein D6712_15230 [Chloroflexota bacterium]